MKKLLCLVLCLSAFCIEGVNAQNKGDMFVGGSLGVNITSVSSPILNSGSAFGFQLAPEFSYFVAKNCKLGAELSLNGNSGYATTFLVQPTFAYYMKLANNLYYTPGIKIGGGIRAFDSDITGIFTFGLDLFALEFKPTKRIGLSVSLVNFNYELETADNFNIFSFDILTSPKFGFHYYF